MLRISGNFCFGMYITVFFLLEQSYGIKIFQIKTCENKKVCHKAVQVLLKEVKFRINMTTNNMKQFIAILIWFHRKSIS